MSQAPAWVIALRKSNRVLRDNDHVYATLEVIKAQYNRYDQDGKKYGIESDEIFLVESRAGASI